MFALFKIKTHFHKFMRKEINRNFIFIENVA